MAGMAIVACGGCGHSWKDHESVDYGPTTCKVEGCDCCSGPARRDDLVDAITNARSSVHDLMYELQNKPDMNREQIDTELQKIINQIDANLEICEG